MARVFVLMMRTAGVIATVGLVLLLIGAGLAIWTDNDSLDRAAGRLAATGGVCEGMAFLVGWLACCPIKGGPLDSWENRAEAER